MAATVDETPRASAPWWHWLVTVIGLLWNGYGAYDYLMTKSGGEAYLRKSGMTDDQVAFMLGYPLWMDVVYAVGIWSGVIGAVLLVVRSRFAVHAFVASLAAFLVSLAYSYGVAAKLMTTETMVMQGVVLVGCVVFAWYAWAMAKRGLLR